MPKEFLKESNHADLEQEIQELANEVQEKVSSEKKDPQVVKDAIRDSLKSKIENVPHKSSSVLPSYMEADSVEIKLRVEKLVDEAFHEGILKTLNKAKKEGPFFVDALHDVLSEKLYKDMKERDLL